MEHKTPCPELKKYYLPVRKKPQTSTPLQTLQTLQTPIPTMVMELLNMHHQEDMESMY